MKTSIRVESLADPSRFRRRRDLAWKRNAEYWLKSPLRHVLDVGDEIVDRVEMLCRQSRRSEPVVLDVGCGNAWLLRKMRRRAVSARYIGVDNNAAFIEHCRSEFSGLGNASFELADLERRRHPQRTEPKP